LQIVGFDSDGKITNHHKSFLGNLSWYEIVDQSTKILTFIDIGTNEKFAVSGISSYYPAYSLLVTSAKAGLTPAFESHLNLALVTQVPFIVVITQEDVATEDEIDSTISKIKESLKGEISRDMIPIQIHNKEDVVLISRTINKEKLVPIFVVDLKFK
jgi:GTPase